MKLIFNGDDFGITKGCNHAILDCYQNGILRSASLMTNMPGVEHAVQLMKEYPKLSVGLHLNLTVGYPLCKDVSSLIKEDGTFNKGMLKDSSHVNAEDVRKELQAQFDRFVALCGQKPKHINSHHGIEFIQGAGDLLLEMAHTHDVPIRQFFTSPQDDQCPYVIPKLCMIQKEEPSQFVEVQDIIDYFDDDKLRSDDIYEIIAHPGYVDYELLKFSSLTTGRCYDAHNAVSEVILDWIKQHHIELISYEDLPNLQ